MNIRCTGSDDVGRVQVAHVQGSRRVRSALRERRLEDPRVRLLVSDDVGIDHHIEVVAQPLIDEPRFDRAIRVADDREL